jgi:hypothetical protein
MKQDDTHSFDGYKKMVLSQVNVTLTTADDPHGGNLVLQSDRSWLAIGSTATNSTGPQNNTGTNPVNEPLDSDGLYPIEINLIQDEYKGYSKAALAGGIVGSAIGGVLTGALIVWLLKRHR